MFLYPNANEAWMIISSENQLVSSLYKHNGNLLWFLLVLDVYLRAKLCIVIAKNQLLYFFKLAKNAVLLCSTSF